MTDDKPLTQARVRALSKQITGEDRSLMIPRCLISLTRDHVAALLLSQILYWWERRDPELDGWFYKSLEGWQEELGLSPYQIRRALKLLEPLGVSTATRRVRGQGAPTLHYAIDKDAFTASLIAHLKAEAKASKVKKLDNRETPQSESEETSQLQSEGIEQLQSEETSHSSISESSSQMTSETTHTPRAGELSRFNLSTCELYAATLKGLHTPDAYARTIFCSGDNDNKIAAWLSEVERRTAMDRQRREAVPDAIPGTPRPECLALLLEAARARMNPESYKLWFEPITQLVVDSGVIRLGVPNAAFRDWITTNYHDVLEEAVGVALELGRIDASDDLAACSRVEFVVLSADAGAAAGV